MKLNVSFPATGCQKLIEVDDERKLRTFYEKRMATEVAADALGEKDMPGLTDTTMPRRLEPKRASRICKLFNLSKEDDVRQYVVTKPLNKEGKKPRTKAPKIQRLVTPRVLQHKRRRIALKKQHTKNKEEAAEYAKLLAKRMEAKEKRQKQTAKRRRLSSLRASTSKSESSQNEMF
ncbi:40S ribosomal protein S6 [Camelus dromedarius]|uniref:Small ribosomal subunit protein eS6 n=1 Tax=Camelus dromedarius TaxID=9838 RepID=A0A5N4DW71_CAMDR|nr:40S ribosomal protein S6 [Camelus dromedarius]